MYILSLYSYGVRDGVIKIIVTLFTGSELFCKFIALIRNKRVSAVVKNELRLNFTHNKEVPGTEEGRRRKITGCHYSQTNYGD